MGFKVMSWVSDHSEVTGSDRLVLFMLADHADDESWGCWPSVARLAHKTRLDERTVRRSLRSLEEGGHISSDIGGGQGKTNHYILLKGGQSAPVQEGVKGGKYDSERGASTTPKGGKYVDIHSPILNEPPENRHIEPSSDFPSDSKIPPADSEAVSPPPVLFRPTSRPVRVLTECAELLGKRYHPSASDKGHLERQDAAQRAIDQGTWQAWRQSLWDALVTADNCEKAVRDQCFAVAGFGRGFGGEPAPRRREVAKSASPPTERFPRYKNAQERSDEMWAKIDEEMRAEEEAENG